MSKNFKEVGRWWNDSSIELIEKDGNVYALAGWNGEKYYNCWKVIEDGLTASEEEYIITPIYNQIDDDEFEVVNYEISE